MDKMMIDNNLRSAKARVDKVLTTVSTDASYAATSEKLKQICSLIAQCENELKTW